MALSKQPYRGTRDFFPIQMRQREFIFEQITKTAHNFCFESYDGPLLEEVDLYLAKSGEELINEQIYSFVDRGDRKVAIRPEMTPTLARMVAQIHREFPKPIRWFSIPNLMRYEKPQKGRLREHWQFNADIFGAEKNLGECEILKLIVSILKSFGANQNHFEILLNDRRIVEVIFKSKLQIDTGTQYKIYKIIDKAKKVSADALDKMLSEYLQGDKKDFFLEYLNLKSFNEISLFIKKYKLEDETQDFLSFVSLLKSWDLETYCLYDPTIVRGLDYYTGIVFEVFDKNPENRRALCGGGAYDNLLQIFNEDPLPGVGVGMGDVTLTDFLLGHKFIPEIIQPPFDLLVAYMNQTAQLKALEWTDHCRKLNLNVELLLGEARPKKAFSYAEKKGHKGVLLIGENELDQTELVIKNLKLRTEKKFTLKSLDELKGFLCNQ
jgi:histidyl-tRNA synthetase